MTVPHRSVGWRSRRASADEEVGNCSRTLMYAGGNNCTRARVPADCRQYRVGKNAVDLREDEGVSVPGSNACWGRRWVGLNEHVNGSCNGELLMSRGNVSRRCQLEVHKHVCEVGRLQPVELSTIEVMFYPSRPKPSEGRQVHEDRVKSVASIESL
jgi:hypothetical protein